MTDGRPRSLRRRALKAGRRIVGERGAVETSLRSTRNFVRFHRGSAISRTDTYAVKRRGAERFGIFGMGGCDLRTIVYAGDDIARHVDGTLGIAVYGHAPETRSDVLLQSLASPDHDLVAEVAARLELMPGYFEPRLFTPDFALRKQIGTGRFPKNVVVMSVSADVSRTMYRHRTGDLLVDPGGWWLNADVGDVLTDLSTVKWFAANFRKIGRISVDDSMANFAAIINEVRRQTEAFVVMMNVLTADPGRVAATYSHAISPHRVRRRQFALALADLAAELRFPIIDVDRIAKGSGISEQADFVHYTGAQKRVIASELTDLLLDAGVIGNRATTREPAHG